jgi:hypothetical protein
MLAGHRVLVAVGPDQDQALDDRVVRVRKTPALWPW